MKKELLFILAILLFCGCETTQIKKTSIQEPTPNPTIWAIKDKTGITTYTYSRVTVSSKSNFTFTWINSQQKNAMMVQTKTYINMKDCECLWNIPANESNRSQR
jgi:hypothetical protein